MGKLFNNTDIIWSLLVGMFAPLQPDFMRKWNDHPKLPRKLKKRIKKEMRNDGLDTKKVSKIILCSEYIKRVDHCKIAWLHKYYKSVIDAEQVKKSYKERYQRLAESEWFKEHYEDKPLGEAIDEE